MALAFGSPVSLKGPKGDPGSAGSQIYEGTGLPDATLGVTGDYFFATDTYTLFRREDAGWPASGSVLKGAKGDMGLTGVDGASFTSGSGDPTAGNVTGSEGDLYLDLPAGEIFKYANGAWSDQGQSLKGPAGPAGNDGLRGSQIYTGVGTADAASFAEAAAGDLYLDTSSGNLFIFQETSA